MSNFKEYLDTSDESYNDEYLSALFEAIYSFLDEVDVENLTDEQYTLYENILELTADDEILDEAKYKRVVRGGKRQKKRICKPGYKSVNGKCVRISASEKRARSKAAKRSAKKKKGKQSSITRKRKKSIKRRL